MATRGILVTVLWVPENGPIFPNGVELNRFPQHTPAAHADQSSESLLILVHSMGLVRTVAMSVVRFCLYLLCLLQLMLCSWAVCATLLGTEVFGSVTSSVNWHF